MKRRRQGSTMPFPGAAGPGAELLALLSDLWLFVRATGKWWLIPVLLALLVLGAVAVVSGTCYAPFIYTLF